MNELRVFIGDKKLSQEEIELNAETDVIKFVQYGRTYVYSVARIAEDLRMLRRFNSPKQTHCPLCGHLKEDEVL